MWRKKLCIATSKNFGVQFNEQLEAFKSAGFDGFFIDWDYDTDIMECKKKAENLGLKFQSVHAPFGGSADMWGDNEEEGKEAENELIDCVNSCADADVDLMIAHAFIGFEDHTPTDNGIKRFGKVIDAAYKKGVKIAFENTEGEEYLAALLKEFGTRDCVGFCWDSGHEMCYNHSQDLLALYGDLLLGTHLNDNLGIADYEGKITWHDDLHLLPFDGIADWNYNAQRLMKCNFDGPLTFELNMNSKPERHDNDKYGHIPFEQYIAEAYARACRVATIMK